MPRSFQALSGKLKVSSCPRIGEQTINICSDRASPAGVFGYREIKERVSNERRTVIKYLSLSE